MLNIALAQVNPTVGDIEANLATIELQARAARDKGAHMVVFPELAVSGYYPGDLLDDTAFAQRLERARLELLAISRRLGPFMTLVVGLPTPRQGLPGKRWSNSLAVYQGGQVQRMYHKQLLPTYDVFDERRHFEPGEDRTCVFTTQGVHVGFLICEDAWNLDEDAYAVNPFERLRQADVDLVVSINASPCVLGKQAQRRALIARASQTYRLPVVYVNQVGGQDSLVFDGSSFATNPQGEVVFEAASFAQDLRVIAFDPVQRAFCERVSAQSLQASSVAPVLDDLELMRRQIVLGLQDYARRCGFSKVVVGSSGGIDSALTLALAVQALGAANVASIAMPSRISSAGSVIDAAELASRLGIEHHCLALADMVETAGRACTSDLAYEPQGVALENLQARLRGMMLMTYSNSFGHLVLTTGNKSELSVGYATLYGDMSGGLGLIGDLYKTDVYALARYLNTLPDGPVIPEAILTKEPSAELAPGQLDRDSLPPYDVLDVILKYLIEGSALPEDEYAQILSAFEQLRRQQPETISKVQRLVAKSEYKRRQAAPILKLRRRSFGAGRQIPITARQFE